MNLIPIISDLTRDYSVKGHYAMRGKPPQKTWIRRHTRGEGISIKDKARLTDKYVQWRHKKSKNIPHDYLQS